jgi:hypothetical protein
MPVKINIDTHNHAQLLADLAERTSQTAERFLHREAQYLAYAIKEAAYPERTLADIAESDAMAHLTGAKSPHGLRVRPSARERAEALMGEYQQDLADTAADARQTVRRLARSKSSSSRAALKRQAASLARDQYQTRTLSGRLMLRLSRNGNTRTDASGRGYLTNSQANLKKNKRLNVSAIAARNEIKQRRRSGGAWYASWALLFKALRSLPLGTVTSGASTGRGSTWQYRYEFKKAARIFSMTIENAALQGAKPQRLLSDGFERRSGEMGNHLRDKLKQEYSE